MQAVLGSFARRAHTTLSQLRLILLVYHGRQDQFISGKGVTACIRLAAQQSPSGYYTLEANASLHMMLEWLPKLAQALDMSDEERHIFACLIDPAGYQPGYNLQNSVAQMPPAWHYATCSDCRAILDQGKMCR